MELIGFILALVTALSLSLKSIFQKINLKDINSNTLIFLLSGGSLIFWLPFIINIGIPEITPKLIFVFVVGSILFYIGKLFHFKAMQAEDISYIAPLMGLITLGVVFLGIVILGEIPNFYGAFGVALILVSVYILNIQKYHTKPFDPIKHLFTNKGSQFFLVTIFCYSFTNILDKIGVQESYPIFWLFLMNLSLFIISAFGIKKTYKKDIVFFKNNYFIILGALFFYCLGHIAQFTAIQYIFIGYMSAIKTGSLLFTIILGGIFFNEKDLIKKFALGSLIAIGLILIYFGK